jgi:hypothetical protein
MAVPTLIEKLWREVSERASVVDPAESLAAE